MKTTRWSVALMLLLLLMLFVVGWLLASKEKLSDGEVEFRVLSSEFQTSCDDGEEFANDDVWFLDTNSRFSSHFCYGGEAPERDLKHQTVYPQTNWLKRNCVFSNVGVKNEAIVYHVDPSLPPPIWDFVNGKPSSKVDIEKIVRDSTGYTLSVVQQPIRPSDYPTRYNSSVAFFLAFEPSPWHFLKAGHMFMVIWRVFNAMMATELLSTDNVIVFHQEEFVKGSKFFPILGNTSLLRNLEGHLLPAAVLIQGGDRGFPVLDSPMHFTAFKRRALRVVGPPLLPGNRAVIGVQKKNAGGHSFLNHDEIVTHLTTRGFDVVEMQSGRSLSFSDEVKLISHLHVYITPAGGASFSSLFIRDGGWVIYGNICGPGTEKRREDDSPYQYFAPNGTVLHCARLENAIWDRLPYFRKAYISPNSVSDLGKSGERYTERMDAVDAFLDYSYVVPLDKLDELVDEAIRDFGAK